MRIGQFCDTFLPVVDGVGRVVYNYADTFGRNGHESYVIAPMCDMGYRGKYPFDVIDFHGVPVPGTPQYRAGTPILDTHYLSRIDTVKFDIVHAHSPFIAGSEALRIAVKQHIPIVGTFHSKFYDDFYKVTGMKLAAEIGTAFVVEYFRRCDEVWAVSESSADVLHDYGFDGEIQIMHNGVAHSEPDESAEREMSEKLGLGDLPAILFVGQLNWKKNIRTLLEACALLKKRHGEFKLVLAGQGPDREDIERVIADLGLTDNAVFAGHITDNRLLNGLYRRCAIFAFLSLYDNAPMVVREAAVMKTPSLLVRGSCAAEILTDGENGLLCDNSAESACDALANVLFYPDELGRLGEGAYNTIPVSWDEILKLAYARYENLVELNKSRTNRRHFFWRNSAKY